MSVSEKIDTLVVGGGTAGIAAAVSAARSGARALLLERRSALGGMASNALVHTLCGLYLLRRDETLPLAYANEGFPREFAERLIAAGGASAPARMGKLDVLPHRPAALAAVADEITRRTSNLSVLLHTDLTGIESASGQIQAARFHSRGSVFEVEVKSLIDASGDAEAAALAGADFECAPPDRLQRPAYIFGIGGADEDALEADARLKLAHLLSGAVTSGLLPPEALGVAFRYGMSQSEIWATLDLQADPYDPCSPECLTRVESCGRRMALEIIRFLRSHAAGFENSRITCTPAQAGIRESRRVSGLACLTEEDILQGRPVENPAALACWPLELRENANGPRFRFPVENRPAGISLDCLRSRTFENLFVAGRCISCTHEAQASIRVTGTCLATGEAAGKAAAAF
ncbi:MAG: FAD-dependent oxidoreductase [Spartobacteria bacterium]